jgi:hypothetical protein
MITFLAPLLAEGEDGRVRTVELLPAVGTAQTLAEAFEKWKSKAPGAFLSLPIVDIVDRQRGATLVPCRMHFTFRFNLFVASLSKGDTSLRWKFHNDNFKILADNFFGKFAGTVAGWKGDLISATRWEPFDDPEISVSATTFEVSYYGSGGAND